MKRDRNITNNTPPPSAKKVAAPPPAAVVSFTPSINSNNEGDNVGLAMIEALERYIKDNYKTLVPPNNTQGMGLTISAKPRKYERISDGKLFDRVYSSEANLWYPDGDAYVMNTLGITRNNFNNNTPNGRKSRKARKGGKGRKARKARKARKTRKF